MSNTAFCFNTWFYVETCCACGVAFAMDSSFRSKRLEKGDSFYCPSGHAQHYKESKIQDLEKRLKWAEESRDGYRERMIREQYRANALKGHQTRLKNRIKNGVCPCCHRSFQNLKNHMKTKHPGFNKDA